MIYQVIIQDEWNNLHHLGFYNELKDSIQDINDFIDAYNLQLTPDMLTTYPGTFGLVFDHNLGDLFQDLADDTAQGVYIRGFIFNEDEVRVGGNHD